MSETVTLVGLDFGTTTSCVAAATAVVDRNARSGRMEFTRVEPFFEPEPVFTPFVDGRIDEARVSDLLAQWFGQINRPHIFAGGALVTGLAAQKANAPRLVEQVRRHLAGAIVAMGNDPRLEAWLAFMGNCGQLSRGHPETTFVNLDVGGGTTNIAFGRAGEVAQTGSYFVGARHIELEPGGYRIRQLSDFARQLLAQLAIRKTAGDVLLADEVAAIVRWNVGLLEALVAGRPPQDQAALACRQAPLQTPQSLGEPAIALSGGVGQLVYRHWKSGDWPATTFYGDLGIDLARRIAASEFWRPHLARFTPQALGRATVWGLLRHNTQVSGATVFLGDPGWLPLDDLVLLGTLTPASSDDEIDRLVALAQRSGSGGCIRIGWGDEPRPAVRALAERIGRRLRGADGEVPILFLMRENLGKVFGHYLTRWGTAPAKVIVIDELDPRDVQFVHVGAARGNAIPVSFYGMN